MARSGWIGALLLTLSLSTGCATDLGTGSSVVSELSEHPITRGRLVKAQMDRSRRLRIYVQLCTESDGVMHCRVGDQRMLAMIESSEKHLLERIATRYLAQGGDRPVYVYGPYCEGLGEMILVPRCQKALAIGVWDPDLQDYIVYSTMHGDSVLESPGFENFIEVTARATSLAKTAAKAVP